MVRSTGVYFSTNQRFYVMGGRSTDTAGSDFTVVSEYNPGTNTWAPKVNTYPDNQVNNMACGVLTVSGTPQIYCVGGSAAGAAVSTARVFSYNPVTDVFTSLAGDNWPGNAGGTNLPGGFTVFQNKLYILGGFTIGGAGLNSIYQFDPTAAVGSKWVLKSAVLPVALAYVPTTTIGTLIFTGGGSTVAAGALTDSTNSFVYNPVGDAISPILSIPRATGETRAVTVGGKMWVLGGGRTAPNPSTEVDIYDAGLGTWSTGLPFTGPRRNFPADSDGTRVFLVGGYDNTGIGVPVNTMQIFSPGACPTPTPTPTPTSTPTATVTPSATPATPTPTPSVTPATPTPSPTPTVTPGTPTPTPSPTVTPATPTPSPTVTPATPTPTAPPTATPSATPLVTQAINLSTRMRVQVGDKVGIGGFIITGSAPKQVLLRAIGPSLTHFGVPDVLADPVMELHGPGAFATIINDNWRDTQETEIQATGIPPTDNLESAILVTLTPGAYTAIVKGKNNTSGVGLIEVYDLDQGGASRLANLSTRAFVSTGSDIVIAGFLLSDGNTVNRMVVRGMGPSLAPGSFPASAVLANPTLELRDNNGALLIANNDWQDNAVQAAALTAAGLAPSNPLEAGIAATLPPGLYTALLAGLNNGTGIGLVEVYDLGP